MEKFRLTEAAGERREDSLSVANTAEPLYRVTAILHCPARAETHRRPHCPKNNLKIHMKTEPDTAGAVALKHYYMSGLCVSYT